MGLIVNTNVAALNARRSLLAATAEAQVAMERLSSGKKINSASDDPAGFAIAMRMTSQIRGLNTAAKNAGDGISMLSAVEGAASDVSDMLQRIRELAVQSVSDTNSPKDREYLQDEVRSLIVEIDRVADQTLYNGESLLDGSRSGSIQVGAQAGQTVGFNIKSIRASDLGESGFTAGQSLADIDLSLNPSDALEIITGAIEQVAGDRAGYGALQNRLDYTVSNLLNVVEFTVAARSRIEDADFAVESSRLAKARLLQQASTAMLAQANASSSLALSLIKHLLMAGSG